MNPKRIVFLNVPIITNEGAFIYMKCSAEYAEDYLKAFPDVPRLSAVGHQSTAEAMTELLHEEVQVNRIEYEAATGDMAIIMKLNGRLPEGKILDRVDLEEIGFSLGLLSCPALLAFDTREAKGAVVDLGYELITAHSRAFMGGLGDPEGHLQNAERRLRELMED